MVGTEEELHSFGVFAVCVFSAIEFVTVYLGKKFDNTYMFRDILGLSKHFKTNGFQEEYWLGHRINHGSGRKKDLEIKDSNILQATNILGLQPQLLL